MDMGLPWTELLNAFSIQRQRKIVLQQREASKEMRLSVVRDSGSRLRPEDYGVASGGGGGRDWGFRIADLGCLLGYCICLRARVPRDSLTRERIIASVPTNSNGGSRIAR